MELNNISFSYSSELILKEFSLSIPENRVLTILGPSGCGKTTLLKLISGSITPSKGSIENLSDQISYIFQEPRLLPWLNLLENVAFPLEDDRSRALHYIEEMGLLDHIDKFPSQLSGGMAQRVSIARAFAFNSEIILMDEPFKGLDFQLKVNIFKLFNRLISKERRTALFVTHDIKESIMLGDRIVILGNNPTRIIKEMDNPIPAESRIMGNSMVIELEEDVYSILSNL